MPDMPIIPIQAAVLRAPGRPLKIVHTSGVGQGQSQGESGRSGSLSRLAACRHVLPVLTSGPARYAWSPTSRIRPFGVKSLHEVNPLGEGGRVWIHSTLISSPDQI